MRKALILDFDGVIVESVAIKDWAFAELFKDYPDRLDEILRYHRSHNAVIRFEKFRHIVQEILGQPFDGKTQDRLSRRFSSLVVKKIIVCPLVAGAREFLDVYKNRVPLFLVTINPQTELGTILKKRRLDGYFKGIYAFPWKKPEAFRDILQKEKLRPAETVFIGDSPEDFVSANALGIPFIGRQSDKDLAGKGFPVLKDFGEIKAHLLKQGHQT